MEQRSNTACSPSSVRTGGPAIDLTSLDVIVSLIAGTTTKKGLKVQAKVDDRKYPAGTKVSDADMAEIGLLRDDFHSEWNYEIRPRETSLISPLA